MLLILSQTFQHSTLQPDGCPSFTCHTTVQEQGVVELTRRRGRANGAMQGLQEVACQVMSTHHSLLEACFLCQLQSLLHIRTCVGTNPSLQIGTRTGALGCTGQQMAS